MDNRQTSSLSKQTNQNEEVPMTYYQSTNRFNSVGIPLKPGAKSVAILALQENREREKRELGELNDRLASYIERVRYLEGQNKKLQIEIDNLRGKWGSNTNEIKEKYHVEIHQARHTIDETAKDCAVAELRAKRAEEETIKLKEKCDLLQAGRDSDRAKIELLEKQLSVNEADLNLFRRRLIDLEDEQKRAHHNSQQLMIDFQRITKDLDHEILTRVELENEKQSLADEIHFLKKVHFEEVEELKQMNIIGTTLDPTNFFKHELSNAVKDIRQEYEQLNQQQRTELQSWYQTKVTQAIQEIQSHRAIAKSENAREQEEVKKLRTLASDSHQEIAAVRRRNEELERRVRELEEMLNAERNKNNESIDERDQKIENLRVDLQNLGRNYDELITTKISLDSEISIYRKLLEGEEKREGLKQPVTNYSTTVESTTNSRSYQRTNDSQGDDNYQSVWTTYRPLHSTIFDEVYCGYRRRRRPTSISLNTQWMPPIEYPNSYRRNPTGIYSRILKTETYFGSIAGWEQPQPKAVTPPGSDYTDAYLSAFAPKPIVPTRRIYRLTGPVFANAAPRRTLLFANNSSKTSRTRFHTINNPPTLNFFDSFKSFSPSSSSDYLSSLIPDITFKSQPSSSEIKTHHPDSPSEKTIHSIPRPSSFIVPIPDRPNLPSENVNKSSPNVPTSPSMAKTTYKPSVSFQSAPLSSPTKRIVPPPPPPRRSHMETLVFQHDEDIRSSPLQTPLLESPIPRVETKTEPEPERPSTEDAPTDSSSSKPIQIIEQTLNKYDSIIDQISSILASVSPLSSTVSSMSPGKSVLDYEVTADGSPIIECKTIEPEASEPSTVTKTSAPHPKRKYLIRDDSYEKIITAIADLDSEITPPPEDQEPTTIVIEEEQQSSSSDHVNEEPRTPAFVNEKRRSIEVPPPYEQKLSSITENEESERSITPTSPYNDMELEVPPPTTTITIITESSDQQVDLSSYLPDVKTTEEQTVQPSYRRSSNKKNGKRVTWGEVMVNSSDSEDSLSQSSVEEAISSEKESSIIDEEQISSPTAIDIIDVDDDEVNTTAPIESLDLNDQAIISPESTELPITIGPQHIKSSSSSETSSGSSDSINGQTTSSDLIESRSSQDEQGISSEISSEIQFVPTIDSSKQDATNNENTDLVESPINTLIDSVSTRYTSSDVYHGYLGDHKQFVENRSDTASVDKKLFLLATLRQTLATPATPLIETIQSVVSTMRSLNAIKPVKNVQKGEDNSQDQATTEEPNDADHTYEVQTEVINSQTDQHEVSVSSGIESVSEIDQVNSDSELVLSSSLHDSQDIVSTNISTPEETLPGEDEDQSTSDADTIITEPHLREVQQISSIDDSIPEDIVLTPTGDDDEQLSKANVFEEKHAEDKEEITPVDIVPEVSDVPIVEHIEIETTPEENQPFIEQGSISIESIQDFSSLLPEKAEFSPDKETISLTTASSQVSDDRLTQSTMHHQPSDIISLTNDVTTTEETDRQNISTGSLMTEPLPLTETNETTSPSHDQQDEFILQTVDQLINDIIQTVSSELRQNSFDTYQELLSTDSDLTQSTIPQTYESVNTEIEPINSPTYIQELSPANTEPDSFDLIDALRGHIILLPNSSEQIHQSPPKSPSTTTSSQVTSSDRYVSMAIHQMGDSSLDRLPAFPLAADLPIYRSCEENASPKQFASSHQTKEEDSTEFDATDNLTSYSDESLIRRFQTSAPDRQKHFDPSSTEDDVDEEIEQHDLTDLGHIIDRLAEPNSSSISRHDESYHRYDQAVTLSSNDDSSISSSRQRPDDFYYIPGYSGLWRPFGNNENANASVDYDADDERRSVSKARTFIRPLNSTQRPLSFEHPPNQSTISTEPESQFLNEFPHDPSESDSYQTCPSSIPKPIEDSNETTPDESIYLIRPYERGVSLPITMKIDCDDMVLRLSTSSPIETPLYSINPPDSSPSSAHSEPIFLAKRDSTSPPSSSSSTSQQSDQQKVPSWLDTVNTITTTTEGPVESRITFLKSAKGPIIISECHSQGNYIIIENTSRSKTVDLTHWKLYQENDDEDKIIYTFPDHCLLKPNHSLKILTQTYQSEQRNDDLIAYSLSSWYTGPNIFTKLINQSGKDCATLMKTTLSS